MAATLPQRQQQLGADQTVTNFLEKTLRQPSMTSWCARQMSETLLVRLNCSTQLSPKRQPAPRGETDHPSISSGSDHMRSHMGPLLGISCLRSRARTSSRWLVVGERPPWTQKIFSSTMAASGRKSKTSVQYFQTLRQPYLRRHSSQNPYTCVICRDSWFPRSSVTRPSQRTFSASSRMKVSTEQSPRSTKSPRKRQVMKGGSPPMRNSSSRSQNCPWMSPQMVTGESTRVRFDSFASTSFALSHSSFTELSSMNSLLRTRRTIYSTVRRSFFIQIRLQRGTGKPAEGVSEGDSGRGGVGQKRVLSYLFVMIIKRELSRMLAKCLLAPLTPRLLALPRFACSQLKLDFFASNYHRLGPAKFRRSRAVERLLAAQLPAIEGLQGRLQPLRRSVLCSPSEAAQVEAYVGLYEQLREAVASCQINNEWVYNVISWYNMTPFYRVLFERLLRAAPDEVDHLVRALHAMHARPHPSLQDLLKEPVLESFYKRLDSGLEVGLLRKLEEVVGAPLAFQKRKYYERYLQDNLEGLLKSLNAGDAGQVGELVWLFEAAINAMCDDEVLIAKIEKAVLTMRLPLAPQDLERLIAAYSRKGRISMPIYHHYLRPYVLAHKLHDPNEVVRSLKFLICSEAEDEELLHSILARLEGLKSTSCLTAEAALTLHLYSHYLRIKGVRVFYKKSVEAELQAACRTASKDHPNYIARLVSSKDRKTAPRGLFNYSSECTAPQKEKMTPLTPEEQLEFEEAFGYRLGSLDLKSATIYKQARFCCIDLEYCIHYRGSGGSSEIIDLESDCGSYVFSSGRLAREVEVRDELLGHYGVKVNHFNLMRFKGKGRMTEAECLINRRVASTPY